MAKVVLQIESAHTRSVQLRAFIRVVQNLLAVLKDLDQALSRSAAGTLEWVVSDLSKNGRLSIEAEAVLRVTKKPVAQDVASRVAQEVVLGLNRLEMEGATPGFLSDYGVRQVKHMLKQIGREGISGITVKYQTERAQLTSQASANVEQLGPKKYESSGSVEGRLEAVSVHGHKPAYIVYHDITNKAVKCSFDAAVLETVTRALGRRVNASGIVHWNARGEPLRVEDADLRILRNRQELPSLQSLRGMMKPETSEGTTADIIRSMRGYQ